MPLPTEIQQDDYYSYDPRGYLSAPVILLSGPEAGACAVASLTSQRTGLPYTELSRWVEHKAGTTIRAVLEDKGRKHLGRLYADGLKTALSTPNALVAAPTFIALGFWSRLSLRGAHVFALDDAASKVPWAIPLRRSDAVSTDSDRLLTVLAAAGVYTAASA